MFFIKKNGSRIIPNKINPIKTNIDITLCLLTIDLALFTFKANIFLFFYTRRYMVKKS